MGKFYSIYSSLSVEGKLQKKKSIGKQDMTLFEEDIQNLSLFSIF